LTISVAPSRRNRSTSVRTPRSSFSTAHCSTDGRVATTNSALATSIPTSMWILRPSSVASPGPWQHSGSRLSAPATVRALTTAIGTPLRPSARCSPPDRIELARRTADYVCLMRRLLLVICVAGCIPAPSTSPISESGVAVIARDSAYFLFPAAATPALGEAPADRRRESRGVRRYWTIEWDKPHAYIDSVDYVSVVHADKSDQQARSASLAEMLRNARGEEGHDCNGCEPANVVVQHSAHVVARAYRDRVMIIVRGGPALRHLLGARPREVSLTWGAEPNGDATVPVTYR
jgi:hypothetical protein